MKLPTRKWKPEKGEEYWTCDCELPNTWENTQVDKHLLREGYVFASRELARKASEEVQKLRQMVPKAPPSNYPTQKYERRSDNPRAFKDMSPAACAYWLNEEQSWRRGERLESPMSPKELGVLIDRIIHHLLCYEPNYH